MEKHLKAIPSSKVLVGNEKILEERTKANPAAFAPPIRVQGILLQNVDKKEHEVTDNEKIIESKPCKALLASESEPLDPPEPLGGTV
ncbi:hypothetical protein E2542_SST30269 [Spatholobus suberectus]|nr:hypothetical protein E2542_SST30269 [Spatholobus suberectus]